ncbi:MAG TPA: hypothetical protein VMV51_05100 [Gemmatimonadaceae bacterium]|nr:hypothetical protein [Gemmatimonadaceae bacterium]
MNRAWRWARMAALAGAWLTAPTARLAAQAIAPSPEVRADVLGAAPYALQLGAGVNLGAGYYQRVELDGAVGARRRGGALVGSGRADALMRLLLDPFGQRRWALSLAGGVSLRYEAGDKVRPYLAGALDLEGPVTHGIRTAYQVGVGGGVRVGIVLRRTRTLWR